MPSSPYELTVLMPCLNEARTIGACIEAAQSYFRRSGLHAEVLIADNGSTDNSPQIATAGGARVVHVPVRGYGSALLAGIESAQGRFVIMGDADCSYDFSRLDAFVERLRAGADIVMGNRFQGGIEPGAMPFLHRYLGNPVLSFVGRLFFRTPIGDFHCGLRGFSRDAVRRLGLVSGGMEFASEMIAKAAMAGCRIDEVPTVLRPDGRDRPPHLRTWRDGWRHLRFLLLFCPRWLFLYPGLALLAGGVGGFVSLQPWTGLSFSVGARVHTMLYMAGATVIGVQLVQLAVLTKWLGVISGIVPEPAWMARTRPLRNVEMGLLSGGALFLLGLAWSVAKAYVWGSSGFGALDPVEGMRTVIPAVTLMIVGMQSIAGALFAGAVQLCWRSIDGKRGN
ncbi:glycosyltransferase family 2 protein [uncultured Ramlibacter sp.]|uniref:glycosyltransferase family 2 protein n=1 Tax=uncultured Ramlibacter sp. TaxID=260755 RepID=UPI00260D0F23|nr:glycosyltransferase family 2 protein [uncultured Ramlibacter sp.]